MIKKFLIAILAVVVLVVVYLGWFVFTAVTSQAPVVKATGYTSGDGKYLAIEIILGGIKRPATIHEITLSRILADSLHASPPQGFEEKPLQLSKDEPANPDTVKFVEKYNKETVRWVGEFNLAPEKKHVINIPAPSANDGSGKLTFQYDERVGVGGTIRSFDVSINRSADVLKKTLGTLNLDDPIKDVEKSATNNDLRFVGIYGYSCSAPGVKEDYLSLTQKYGLRCLKGTSDNIEDDEHFRLIQTAIKYAEKYNINLLKKLKAKYGV